MASGRLRLRGAREIIESFANLEPGSVVGARAPGLWTGGDVQYEMLRDEVIS